ncbi:MAG: TerB family tellurite resistance protein [Deltaproteobacteria bacterium]|jgi:tellurite resistance protein|nr:TerB family tellurite resistance protein [Deltaproteobacteria bacterium]
MKPSDLHREVIKLLIQVAWADQQIVDEERDHLLTTARSSGLSDEELADIEAALSDPASMTPPDFELLKRYKQDAKRAATVLMRIDGKVSAREVALLASINELLGEDPEMDI